MFVHPVERTKEGDFELQISQGERDLLKGIPVQLRDLLENGDRERDPALLRLFPDAYRDDPERSSEYSEMVGGELRSGRLSAAAVMERTIDAERLSEEEITAWLSSINDVRIVMGTRLDVTEETRAEDFEGDEDRGGAFAVYLYLTYLEDHIVTALQE